MSLNSSIQHLGTGVAALVSGFIVKTNANRQLLHYEWVGYLSVGVLFIALLLGFYLFRDTENGKKAAL